MRFKCLCFGVILLAQTSEGFSVEGLRKLPKCERGIAREHRKFYFEENTNCRWEVPKELSLRRHIKFYEIKSDCSDNEDQLIMLDGEEIIGPFCHREKDEYNTRHRRGPTLESTEYEVDVPLLHPSEGTEIIYITAPNGYKFRFKFNFEWELISTPGVAFSNSTSPIYVPSEGICGPGHFAPSYFVAFSKRLSETEFPESAQEGMSEFSAAMTGFENYFDSHFSQFCSSMATQVPCEFFWEANDEEITAQDIFASLEGLIRFILSHCEDGFGYNWEASLEELKNHVGGDIPVVSVSEDTKAELCGPCSSDIDCGSFSDYFLKCSEETKKCVCADKWIDENGNPNDGCEVFRGDAAIDHFQCESSSTSTTTLSTTSSAVTSTTLTTTTTTSTEAELEATTEIVKQESLFKIMEVSSTCPSNWQKTPMTADENPWNSILHSTEEMCLFANLPACSESLFKTVLKSNACHNERLLEIFQMVVQKVAEVSVSGDFDRTCLYSIHEAPCHLLDFKQTKLTRNFVYQLIHVLKKWALEKCGKNHLKSFLLPKLLEMLAIVDESRDNECPSLPITFNISEEEFDNLNFSELPEKSAQMQTIDHATPRPIVNRFTTLKDGLCAAKSFGRLAPVVFKARAFDIRNPELAIDRFKSFAEEVGKVGKKTAQLERRKRKCDLANAGKMPCQLLDYPTDEMACQLALRAKEVYEYMSERCDLEWRQYYGNIIDELIESSENSDGSPCSDGIDEKAMLTKTRKLSKKFKKKHGYHFKEALAEAKAQLKQEREDAKVSRLALKKQREQEKHNVRVEKLKTLASNRLEAAMLEVNKKQEKLEALKIAVAAAEAGNFALLERRQTKKESNVMLLDVFGIEESEEEEEEEYQCSFPENLPFEEARENFEGLTSSYLESTRLISFGIVHRVRRRFFDALDYIEDSQKDCLEQQVLLSCRDLHLIFYSTDSEDRHVKLMIKAAANLVTQVERECAKISFPEFYITIRGKSTSIIM